MVCEKGYMEVAQKLLDAKADVNLCDQVSNLVEYYTLCEDCTQ